MVSKSKIPNHRHDRSELPADLSAGGRGHRSLWKAVPRDPRKVQRLSASGEGEPAAQQREDGAGARHAAERADGGGDDHGDLCGGVLRESDASFGLFPVFFRFLMFFCGFWFYLLFWDFLRFMFFCQFLVFFWGLFTCFFRFFNIFQLFLCII